jgi:hypothetical protein
MVCLKALYWVLYSFLLYINDLPKLICDLSKPILFADNTSIIILDKDPTNFKIKTNKIFDITNEWFATNLLIINYEKTNFLQFQTKNKKRLCGNLPQYNRQSLLFQLGNPIHSIGESLLPKTYGKAQIFIHYQPANQRSQQHHEHN